MSAVPQQIPRREEPLNLYQRINEVRKKVDYVQKKEAVEGYKAVTHDQITAMTRDFFVEFGIVIVPMLAAQQTVPTGTATAKGTPFVRWEGSYKFDVVNIDDPMDRFTAEIAAHALDHGDKAPGKALSYAKKALILKLLEIESGEDDEDRPEQKPVKATVIKPSDGAMESLTVARRNVVMDTAVQVQDYLQEGKDFDAFGLCESLTDPDEKIAMWSLLNSSHRSRIKAASAAQNKKGAENG